MQSGEYTVTGCIDGVEQWLQYNGRRRDGRSSRRMLPARRSRVAGVTLEHAESIVRAWPELGLRVVKLADAPVWERTRKGRR